MLWEPYSAASHVPNKMVLDAAQRLQLAHDKSDATEAGQLVTLWGEKD